MRVSAIILLFTLGLTSTAYSGDSFQDFETLKVVDEKGLERELIQSAAPSTSFGPIYNTILDELENEYEIIGQRQADRLLNQRDGFYLGGLNNVGYTFKKGFSYFDVNIERQVAPDLFDDQRYIVSDKFELVIDATKLFSSLDTQGLISMTEEQMSAYAGVMFKRTYRYTHFADTYQDALTIDLHKLFMAFTYTRNRSYLDIADYEILQREDYLSLNVGGVVVAPLATGVGVGVGAMAKYESLFKLEIQGVGEQDQKFEGESLRISYEKTKGKTFGASARLQVEFLKFLRLTLLSYDFRYSYEESQKTFLSLSEHDIRALKHGDQEDVAQELDDMLLGRSFEPRIFSSFEVGHERRINERKTSRYMALLFGGFKDQQTEHIQIGDDQEWSTFFRHNFEKVSYEESFVSRLLSSLFGGFIQSNTMNIQRRYSDTKKHRVEYQSSEDLLKSKKDITLDFDSDDPDLSLSFERIIQAQDTKKKKIKKKVLRLLDHFSGVDPLAPALLKNGALRAPLVLKSKYSVKQKGVEYFNKLGAKRVHSIVKQTCRPHSRTFWQRLRNLFGGCKHKLNRAFDYYWVEYAFERPTGDVYRSCKRRNRWRFPTRHRHFYTQKCIQEKTYKQQSQRNSIPLWRLSGFSQALHEYSENKLDMIELFGLSHVFLYGSFEAQSDSGTFTTHFNEGAFSGLGVVDQHMRRENLRSPASVNIED